MKGKWFERIYFEILLFLHVAKMAFIKPKHLLLPFIVGYCPVCKRKFIFPEIRRQNTSYMNEVDNYICCCDDCYETIETYWDERWDEYYNSVL